MRLVELDERKKKAADVTTVEDAELRTILAMMLDPETRRHTVGAQRKGYKELREAVDEFVNAVNVGGMDLGEFRGKNEMRSIEMVGELGDPRMMIRDGGKGGMMK